tara:strand:+ start:482 stop:583 length:102 start_codon:yes stop_codon:yes gene_type:complete
VLETNFGAQDGKTVVLVVLMVLVVLACALTWLR